MTCLAAASPPSPEASADDSQAAEPSAGKDPEDSAAKPEEPEEGGKTVLSGEGSASVQESPPGASGSGEEGDELKTVVTATRMKASWKDSPAMVTVIDKKELKKTPEKNVDDFLKRIPSISYSRIHAAECGPGRDITLRGILEQKRTLILLDGIPFNDSVTGAFNWSMIPKEAVERIELVRGPMSALYGSGAMGGVINILTLKPRKPGQGLIKAG